MAVRPGRKPGTWVVEFEQDGRRIHKRLPAGVGKKDALRYEDTLRREIFQRLRLGDKPDLTLPKAIELWLAENRRKNQKQAVSEAKQWASHAEGRYLREAPQVAQEALTVWRMSTGLSHTCSQRQSAKPSTINSRLALLKAVCKHAWRRELIDENLSGRIPMLKLKNAREVYLTKEQVSLLADSSPTREGQAAIIIAAYSGLRASELLALPAVTSRQDTLMVTATNSKTGKPRQVPIAEPLRPYLSVLPLGFSYSWLKTDFSAARKKAKMPHVHFHDLRHTCASWLINAGVDLYTVGRILGHSSATTTARYAHLSDASLKAAMGRLK